MNYFEIEHTDESYKEVKKLKSEFKFIGDTGGGFEIFYKEFKTKNGEQVVLSFSNVVETCCLVKDYKNPLSNLKMETLEQDFSDGIEEDINYSEHTEILNVESLYEEKTNREYYRVTVNNLGNELFNDSELHQIANLVISCNSRL